jgi:hypothetical protein
MRTSLRMLLFCGFLPSLLFSSVAASHAQGQPARCSAAKLDIRVLPEVKSAAASDAHWLGVEIQNRDQFACWLDWLVLKFPPDITTQSGDAWSSDISPAALAFKQKSQQLGSGEIVHFLLAWSSRPLRMNGLVMHDCAEHDLMTLSWASFTTGEPVLEVHHLGMQSCRQFWRSAYRLGPVVAAEPIATEWMERFGLTQSDFSKEIVPELQSGRSAGTPPSALRALHDVDYLKAAFETGYTGYFELFLKLPSPAIANCPFHTLRKREADGQTLVYLNHCNGQRFQASAQPSTKETRLLVRELGLLPERTGHVEYEAVSEVLRNGRPALARAQMEISIRDPNQPMLPAIDTSTPGCLISDLKLTSPPVTLGAHWQRPRDYAPPGEGWHDGKVFEVTNVSGHNCLLGGVPKLKFLEPPEVTSGSLLPTVCRNCASPLFQPRESRWIELKTNESAHFMVERTVLDPDYGFMCTVLGGLEMSLPADTQTLRLPFEAAMCRHPSVSAWRAGPYDGDPMNVRYDREENRREQERTAAIQPLPKECAANLSADTGRPVMMFPSRSALTWGLSSRTVTYGEPVSVLLWLFNPTDEAQPVWTCMEIDQFWVSGIDVFDSSGHRVLTREEEKNKELAASGKNMPLSACMFSCTRNFTIDIAPHSCAHTTFSAPAYDFARDLRTYYSLPPGRYRLVPAEREQECMPVSRTLGDSAIGLTLIVREP